jgi:hypothetical protein
MTGSSTITCQHSKTQMHKQNTVGPTPSPPQTMTPALTRKTDNSDVSDWDSIDKDDMGSEYEKEEEEASMDRDDEMDIDDNS